MKSLRTIVSVLTCILAASGWATTLEAGQICDGGVMVFYNGTWIGCRFPGWGSSQASMCQGTVVLPHLPTPALRGAPGTCFVCVKSPYDKQILQGSWTGFTAGPSKATATTATFPECVAPPMAGGFTLNPNATVQFYPDPNTDPGSGETCPSLSFSYQSRANSSVVNASLALTDKGPGKASNVQVTGMTCTSGFVYTPQNGLLKIPFVVPGAATMTQNAATGFNAFFTRAGAPLNVPFSCTVNWTEGGGCKGTQVVNIQ